MFNYYCKNSKEDSSNLTYQTSHIAISPSRTIAYRAVQTYPFDLLWILSLRVFVHVTTEWKVQLNSIAQKGNEI